jgi:hypothetical protein
LAQDDRTNQFGLTCATSYTSVGNFESETKKFETDAGTSTRNVDGKGTVSTTVQKHSSSDVLAIGINMRVGYGGGNCSTVSLYKWVSEENKPVVKPVPEEKGYWHLNSVKDYGGGTGDNPVKTQHFKSEGGSGYYHANAYQNGSETVYGHECRGEWTDHVLTVYAPLKDKYYAGDTASVGLSYVTNTNIAGEAMKSHGAVYMIDMTLWGYYQEHPDDAEAILDLTHYTGDIEFTDENGKRGFSPEIIEDDSGRYNKVTSGTWLSAKMPEGRKNGEKLYIDHCFSPYGAPGIITVYEYEWITIQEEAELGDVNGDSVINAKDASEVLMAAAKIGTGNSSGLAPELEKVADVNSDGSINAKDANSILRYAAAVGTGVKASIKDYI